MNNLKNNYQAWNWDFRHLPKDADLTRKIFFFSQAGILAASIHNTQPWKFEIKNDNLLIFPDFSQKLKYGDPRGTNIFISLGCCITNIEVVASYCDLKTTIIEHIDARPEKSYVELRFTKRFGNDKLSELCQYITRRYSNKLKYLSDEIPKDELNILSDIKQKGVDVVIVNRKSTLSQIANLQKIAVKGVASNEFTHELGQWVRLNNTRAYDGMPGFVEGFNLVMAILGKIFLLNFPSFIVNLVAKKNKSQLEHCAAAGLLLSKRLDIKTAINIGRAYELIALTATKHGFNCTPMHAVIEHGPSNKKLRDYLGLKGTPEFCFRLGYSNNKSYHTPRRPIESFYNITSETKLIQKIPIKLTTHSIKINSYTIHYKKAGKGPVLILIHGLNIGWGQWYLNIAHFAKRFTVYALDLPGTGNSSNVNFETASFERDFVYLIKSFINKLSLSSVVILGHSLGGTIALKLAIEKYKPIKKIIVVNPVGVSRLIPFPQKMLSSSIFTSFMTKVAMYPTRKNIRSFLTSVMFSKDRIADEFVDYYFELINTGKTVHPIRVLHNWMEDFKLKKELFIGDQIQNLSLPMFWLFGEKDPMLDQSTIDFVKNLASATIHTFTFAGHVPNIEVGEEFNKLVLEFLEKHGISDSAHHRKR